MATVLAILRVVAVVIPFIGRWLPQPVTAADQKASDTVAAVKAQEVILETQAEVSNDDTTKKALEDGKF